MDASARVAVDEVIDKVAGAAAPAWESNGGELGGVDLAQARPLTGCRDLVRARPLTSLGLALAAGFVLGRLADIAPRPRA